MSHRAVVRRKRPVRIVGAAAFLFFFPFLLPPPACAQRDPFYSGTTTASTPGYTTQGGAPLVVTIFAENNRTRLDRQAVVKVLNQTTQTVSWQTTTDQSEATFAELTFGHYDVEVSAVGYLTAHKEMQVISMLATIRLEIVLQRDPAAVDFGIAEAAMPPKARKETKHAVSALKSGNWKEAGKRLDSAYKLAPSNPDLNFLLGYLSYQRQDLGLAISYLDAATRLNPNNVQSLTLLGRINLQQQHYGLAIPVLQRAIAADNDYWLPHQLLAGAYLKQQKYEGAREQAELAIAKGKGGAGSAQLVLGQALVNLGHQDEGVRALKSFLEESPKSATAPQVRNLIAELEVRRPPGSPSAESAPAPATPITGIDPLLVAPEPTFSVKPWQPPGIDQVKPSVAAGVACPQTVLSMAGARVKELGTDVSRIAAIEHLLHEQLDEIGNPITRETRDFNYVASISEPSPGFFGVEEYRAEHLGLADFPDQIASSGFAGLAFVFHPSLSDDFEMTCEGLGDLRGQAAWLVRFQQREDRPARIHDYRVGGDLYALKLKGRAWITADKFQIVRIESELLNSVPKIQLASEHQVVEYGPVPFGKKDLELWLPKSAEIYLDFRRHRYYRKHSFDHYMLFSVDSDEKHKAPKAEPNTAPNPL